MAVAREGKIPQGERASFAQSRPRTAGAGWDHAARPYAGTPEGDQVLERTTHRTIGALQTVAGLSLLRGGFSPTDRKGSRESALDSIPPFDFDEVKDRVLSRVRADRPDRRYSTPPAAREGGQPTVYAPRTGLDPTLKSRPTRPSTMAKSMQFSQLSEELAQRGRDMGVQPHDSRPPVGFSPPSTERGVRKRAGAKGVSGLINRSFNG